MRTTNALIIYASYKDIYLGIAVNGVITATSIHKNARASAHLLGYINELLNKAALDLSQLSFVALDQGPGAFTSLRVVITAINGLVYGAGNSFSIVPLSGLDMLAADMARTIQDKQKDAQQAQWYLLPLFNAYNKELFFSLRLFDTRSTSHQAIVIENNYLRYDQLFKTVKSKIEHEPNSYVCVAGNGVPLFAQELQESFKDRLIVLTDHMAPTLETMATYSWQQYQSTYRQKPLFAVKPKYLKAQNFKKNLSSQTGNKP